MTVISSTSAADSIRRGALRTFQHLGYAGIAEMTLANSRRADLVLIGSSGDIAIVEIKSCRTDFQTDAKWPEYQEYCDLFYFAVDERFPSDLIPDEAGLIIADGFGGAVVRDAPRVALPAARRKAMTLKFARAAALRVMRLDDPVHGG
ncbi:MAG: MmcB family DNA repair protein [Pseudomonadota bacterium]